MIDHKKLSYSRYLLPFMAVGIVLLFQFSIPSIMAFDLPNKLQDFITLSLSIFVEAFPFLVLGSLLAAAVNTYVPHEAFHKILPKNAVIRRIVISFLGFLFPVCECGNVPLSRSLMIQGFKPSEAVTFLLAAPVINPVTIWATWAAFGYDGSIVASRVAATLLIANIVGAILSRIKNEHAFLTDNFVKVCEVGANTFTKATKQNRFQITKLSADFTHEAYTMMKMLAFGSVMAGTIQTFVPRDVLIGIGGNVVLSIIAMLLLAFVVSICANVDAFFALSFANTFTAGSIVSFLVFGPMIDIKLLALLKTTFKNNLLVILTSLVFVFSLITGLVVTYAF